MQTSNVFFSFTHPHSTRQRGLAFCPEVAQADYNLNVGIRKTCKKYQSSPMKKDFYYYV